ncbi:chitin synthase chs-2-like [Babylonia areolata]|uniref:chitin synthase chs-2-like n=1 Tax=Babylonia areolata TaxID=304850 RepID=UPI003FD2D326
MNLKWVWALMMVVTSPYIFTAITCLWKLIFKKSEALRCGPLFAALFVETLHSLGLCTMVFYVLPSFDPIIGCLMLLNIAFFPGLIKMLQTEAKVQDEVEPPAPAEQADTSQGEGSSVALVPAKKKNEACWRAVWKMIDVVMVLLHLGSMLVWSCRAYDVMDDVPLAVLTPASMLLTSLSWWDNYVSGRKKSASAEKKNETGSQDDATKGDADMHSNGTASREQTSKVQTATPNTPFLTRLKRAIKKRRTKITFITSLWKIAFTIGYAALAFGYDSEKCVKSFFFFYDIPANKVLASSCSLFTSLNFVDQGSCPECCHEYYPFFVAAVNIGCSILCYKTAKSACKVLLQIPCLVIPLVLVTPLTLILIIVSYMEPHVFHKVLGCSSLPWVKLEDNVTIGEFLKDFIIAYWVPAGFVAYFSLLYITGHVWNPRAERMSRTDKLFSKPLYCGVFLDQSLMLNRRRDEDDPTELKLAGQWIEQVQDVGEMNLEEASSALSKITTPLIYICATMWHESETEMIMMLKSIFRLDADQSARKNAQLYFNITDPDYYEFEAHIFFDDAFKPHGYEETEYTVNDFVKQLIRVMDTAASAVHGTEMRIPKPYKIPTPYGGRLIWRLPGGNIITAHLKDKVKIRTRKRWSQVMYMYYFLGYKLISSQKLSPQKKQVRADNTFLLALDGDVDFQPDAVQILVDRMKQTPALGAACGRIHPIGSGPMVWYQKFEYAVSHWLQKSTEHILGCVLCSPGCFSLFRGSALMDDNVMKRYTTPPTEARHYVQYDQGEDRWLCTLLLQQGHRVEYCAASDSYTFAPEGFYEFYNQRRRWTPSTMANIIDLLGDWKNTTRNNQDISVLYIIYQLSLLASGIITPGTIFLLIVGAISNATEGAIPLYAGLLLNGIPIVIFVVLCFKADSATQLAYAGVLSILYTIIMMLVLVGIIRGAAENGFCSVSTSFLLGVAGVFVITALLHPMECTALLHGCLYFLSIPSMSMLLLIYSLANLDNVSWGTREVKSAAPPPPNQQAPQTAPKKADSSNFIKEALSKLADTKTVVSDYAFSFGNLFRCMCCPKEGNAPNDARFETIMKSIEHLLTGCRGVWWAGADSKMTELTVTSGLGDSLRAVSELPEDTPPATPTLPAPNQFSADPGPFEGAVQRENPAFVKPARDELLNPLWSEDVDVGDGPKELMETDEREFWNKFIGQYLYPLDKDENHEKAMKAELVELRNKVSLAFLLANTLFVVLISSLQIISENTTNLSIKIPCGRNNSFTGEKIEPISVAFTLVFGIMLTLQFLAMMFHRYSTMLHIISITEIKFKRLTRQVLGMQKPQETQPTVEETINLVREMQAIRPSTPEPEADYDDDDDLKTPPGTTGRKKSTSGLVSKLNARGQRIRREVTLSRAFMRNFEKLANQIRTESTSENSPVELEAGMKKNFSNFERKSLHTIVKMARDSHYKEHIIKRSTQAQKRWRRAFAKLGGGQRQFKNLVVEAKEKKEEEEEEEREQMAGATAAALPHSSSGPTSRHFLAPVTVEPRPYHSWSSRQRQQIPEEEEVDFTALHHDSREFPGYGGATSTLSHRPSSHFDDDYEDSEVFRLK